MPTETKSASQTTTITAGWNNPSNAYASDDQRTDCSTDDAEQEYSGYGFNIPSNATIDKVEVGVEGFGTTPTDQLTVKIFDGSAWYSQIPGNPSSEQMQWLNFTAYTSWTPSKVNAIKTRIRFDITGGGDACYPDKTFLLCVDNDGNYILKRCNEIQAGDMILGYKKPDGYRYCFVVNVEKHEGEFDLLKVTVNKSPVIKNIDIKKAHGITPWQEYIYVTPNHEVCSPSHDGRVKCGLLNVGDLLTDLHLGRMINVPIVSIEKTKFKGTVYNVRVAPHYEDFFYFIVSLDDEHVKILENLLGKNWNFLKHVEFSLFGLAIKTWYVDWLPVRVAYTEAALPTGHSTRMGLTKVGA